MKKMFKRATAVFLSVTIAASMAVASTTLARAQESTGVGLAAHALVAYREGWSYVWGASSYGAVDCSGLIYSYNGVGGVRTDMLASSSSWGYVSNGVPRIHGLGLHQPGHIGVYIGSGMAVDARDENSGVVYHNVYNKSWVEWFKVAGVSYPQNGWVLLDGDSFYYEDGQYVVDTTLTIDGVTYSFDSAGVSNLAPPSYSYEATDYSTVTAEEAKPAYTNIVDTPPEEESSEEEEYYYEEPEPAEESSEEEESSEPVEESSEEEYSEEPEEVIVEEESSEPEEVIIEEESSEPEEVIIEEESSEPEEVITEEESSEPEEVITEEESSEPEESAEESSEEDETSEESSEPEDVTEESSEPEESAEESSEQPDEETSEVLPEDSEVPEKVVVEESSEPEEEFIIIASYGDEDTDDNKTVSSIQTRLYELGYITDKATGYFGDDTVNAIMLFQDLNGLEVTGVVDNKTHEALNSSSAVSNFNVLSSGAFDDGSSLRISALQKRLAELKYFYDEVTGFYGKLTKNAVEQFQTDNGLVVTGIADDETQKAVFDDNAKVNPNAGSISYGQSGAMVLKMQKRLLELRYLSGIVGEDFDDNTLEAVNLYQQTAGLEVSKRITAEQLEDLYSDKAPKSPTYNVLRFGFSGEDVAQLQSRLAALKYYDGKTSGVYSQAVSAAVEKFQKDMSLEVTGEADEKTQELVKTEAQRQSSKVGEQLILQTATIADNALAGLADSKTAEISITKQNTDDIVKTGAVMGIVAIFTGLMSAVFVVGLKRKKKHESK